MRRLDDIFEWASESSEVLEAAEEGGSAADRGEVASGDEIRVLARDTTAKLNQAASILRSLIRER